MKRTEDKALAIIGISCRFPLGDNPRDFCDALLDGQIAFTEVPPDRFDTNKWYSHDRSTPLSTDNKWIAPIADADRFDYSFFGLSRAEARNMDPQQRLVLEES